MALARRRHRSVFAPHRRLEPRRSSPPGSGPRRPPTSARLTHRSPHHLPQRPRQPIRQHSLPADPRQGRPASEQVRPRQPLRQRLGPNPSSAPSGSRCCKMDALKTPATLAQKSSNPSKVTTTPTANTRPSDTKPPPSSNPQSTPLTKPQNGPKISCTS